MDAIGRSRSPVMPSPERKNAKSNDSVPARPVVAPPAKPAGGPGGSEIGWLPDCVYTGEKFESGLAFFADGLGRITRFSREPANLAAARRLAGQVALPGLVNAHSHAFQRALRGRGEQRGRPDRESLAPWREAQDRLVARISGEGFFDTARMAFLEMMLSGITCVGEFHCLHQAADGLAWPDPNFLSQELLRAAHDVGIRIALLKVAQTRADPAEPAHARLFTPTADQFIREFEALRVLAEKNHPADEAWIGVGINSLGGLPAGEFRAIATHAHAQRMRLHVRLPTGREAVQACVREHGRTPVALLAELGIVDKRFTAVHAAHLADDEIKLLGSARAIVCACPTTARNHGVGLPPVEKLLAAGAGIALGSDRQVQIDLLEDARLLEYPLRVAREQRAVLAPDPAPLLFHAATVTGARSLGATGGALEIGRPADFFTVNLYDPSIAGADAGTLLNNIVFSLERRAIRDVWVGARLRIANGRHPDHGAIVGRFSDSQQRLWSD